MRISCASSFARFSYCRRGFARSAHFTSYGNPVYVIEVTKMSSSVHGVENRDSHAKSTVCSFCECVLVRVVIVLHMPGCFVNGVCRYSLAVVQALWIPTGIGVC